MCKPMEIWNVLYPFVNGLAVFLSVVDFLDDLRLLGGLLHHRTQLEVQDGGVALFGGRLVQNCQPKSLALTVGSDNLGWNKNNLQIGLKAAQQNFKDTRTLWNLSLSVWKTCVQRINMVKPLFNMQKNETSFLLWNFSIPIVSEHIEYSLYIIKIQ